LTLRVCYFGAYESDNPRNLLSIAGLRSCGVEVFECHIPVWELTRDKTRTNPFRLAVRLCLAYPRLLRQYLRKPQFDAMIVGYIGQPDVPYAKLLSFSRVPIVFDPLVSLADTLVDDRQIFKPGSFEARLVNALDGISFHMADRVLCDTCQNLLFYVAKFGVRRRKMDVVYLGADERVFFPRPKSPSSSFVVLFYGKFSPLHGIEHIVRAAKLLERERDIKFKIIGTGQLRERIISISRTLGTRNVSFESYVDYHSLPGVISDADLCLGIFGTNQKAHRVIPNKVFQCLAMRKPIVTADTPAVREVLGQDAAMLCPAGDEQALADAILAVRNDDSLRRRISEHGYEVFARKHTSIEIGKRIKAVIETMV